MTHLDPELEAIVWAAEPAARQSVWNELAHGHDDRDAAELELGDRLEDYTPAGPDVEAAFRAMTQPQEPQ